MELTVKVDLTRIIGTTKTRDEIAEAYLKTLMKPGMGLEVGNSGYLVMSVEVT